jgi:hypothetical protein
MRSKDGDQELPLRTYEHFADLDPLARVGPERMLAGVARAPTMRVSGTTATRATARGGAGGERCRVC